MKKSSKANKSSSPVLPTAATGATHTLDAGVTLTDDQMQQLAQSFHDISVEIGQVRLDAIKAGATLTDPRIVQLQGYVFSLKNVSDNLAVQAANLTLQNADQLLNQISFATQTADHALDKLANIDKAVQIASAVIVLGAAITTHDPSQIANAAKSIVTTCGMSVS
jgi:TolA-binding protein